MAEKLDSRQDESITENADISSTGVIAGPIEVPGDRLVSINITATADASYSVDVAATQDPSAGDWFQDEVTYDQADESDPQDIRDAFILGDRMLRVRVTSAAAGGETADVTIQGA